MRLNIRLLTMSAAITALLILSGCGGDGIFPGKDVLLNPEDVTPYWINFSVRDYAVRGDLVYISAGSNGLLIFDYSDRLNPKYVGGLEMEGYLYRIELEGNYAYMVDGDGIFYIIDISSLASPQIVNTVDIEGLPNSMSISNGYAYITDSEPDLRIIDVDPPESAHQVGVINTEYYADEITISGNFAYIGGLSEGLHIVDISDPEAPRFVHTVGAPYWVNNFAIQGDYLYAADTRDGLTIIDIHDPATAQVVRTVKTEKGLNDVDVQGGYLYGATCGAFYVIDVDPVEDAHVVAAEEVRQCPGNIQAEGNNVFAIISTVTSTDGYGYLALLSADISNPAAPSNFREHPALMQMRDVEVYRDYAFTLSGDGMQIIDISPPESAQVVKSFQINRPGGLAVDGGYAAVTGHEGGLFIMDVDPVETAHICGTLSTIGGECLVISDGFLYAASASLSTVDITPPTSPRIIKQISLEHGANGLAVADGYAYVTSYANDIHIFDIDPPDEAHEVKSIILHDSAYGICVQDGYAYVANSNSGVAIVDVVPPDAAEPVSNIGIVGWTLDVTAYGDLVYAACGDGGLQIFDVSDPASPRIANVCDTPGSAYAIDVSGDYAYIAGDLSGLRIIRLW